jgi:hypothetical protein
MQWDKTWVRLVSDVKNQPGAVQSGTRSQFLSDEINFENFVYTLFNE